MDRQCLRRLLRPYYYVAIILALIGVIISIISSSIASLEASLDMLVFSWLFYVLLLIKLMKKINFERDTCLIDRINFRGFMLLVLSYLILSLWGLLNILFYQAFRECGMNTLFTLYSTLFAATLTSTSILFTLGNWIISRRDREDERLIAITRATLATLFIILVGVLVSLLLAADLFVMQKTILATFFLAAVLGLIITMAQTLVIIHALMDILSGPVKSKDEAKDQGAKEGTGGASKP